MWPRQRRETESIVKERDGLMRLLAQREMMMMMMMTCSSSVSLNISFAAETELRTAGHAYVPLFT